MSPTSLRAAQELTADALSASGRTSEKVSLPTLQSKMKCDPEGYETELTLVYSQFQSSLELFQKQAALHFTSISGVAGDPTVAKDLGDRAMFLAHVTPFYPKQLAEFPQQLVNLLRSTARTLPSGLRVHIVQALILMLNRKVTETQKELATMHDCSYNCSCIRVFPTKNGEDVMFGGSELLEKEIVDISETLALFMELQILGDKTLKTLAFSHLIHSIRHMNQKHKNEAKNRALQNILFAMLQGEDEALAKRSLITICDLHRRKVWFDDRTANAICGACFHSSSRIMIAALSFLLGYEKIENDDDSDASSDENDSITPVHQVNLSKEAIYKANNTGTTSSKKKKKAKLQRVLRSMKKQQRISSEKDDNVGYYSPLNHLNDPQGFAEKLFSRLQTCNERFEVKMMLLKIVSRTVGLHRLILLKLYPFLLNYVKPHQRDVTNLLAAAVQACHDMVPPDAVEELFRKIVNQFVHDRSSTEAIAVGLNVVREICLRMPLLMTEDLLQDLVLYKKSHEKAVASAARALLTLFREICPSLLIKKDRGRPSNPKARPKAYGEVTIDTDVPGVELLQDDDGDEENDDDVADEGVFGSSSAKEDNGALEEDGNSDVDRSTCTGASEYNSDEEEFSIDAESEDDEVSEDENAINFTDDDDSDGDSSNDEGDEDSHGSQEPSAENASNSEVIKRSKGQKRKFTDFDGQLNAASKSLRALKRLAGETMEDAFFETTDGILSNEDFKRIKELRAKKEAKIALTQHGLLRKPSDAKSPTFKIPTSDQLSLKRVDGATLEANIRKKMSKEERLALIRAGREEGGKYQARAAIKKKKTGGLSNRQKEHKKAMPMAAKRAKVAKSRQEKKKKQRGAAKQFRGRKAWK